MRLRKRFLTAFGFSILVLTLLLAGSQAGNAVPSDKDVVVVNTTAQPVPTAAQGVTPVSGSVSVTNTPTVGIDPAHNLVQVATTPTQPFQAYMPLSQSGTNVTSVTLATVPAGKRLVIEFVAFTGQVPPGDHVELMDVNTVAGSTGAQFQMLVNPQPNAVSGDSLFRASQQVKIYADPGTSVQTTVRRATSAGTASYGLAISGHLENL